MPQHLILRLEAPLMAFGGTMIDANGPTLDLPIRSMVTGLIANALGWQRGERDRHQRLQDRLVMGARLDRTGTALRDFQTVQLGGNDKAWTTRGLPEGRAGGANTYKSPHIRQRHYRADAFVTVALRLDPPEEDPTLATIEAALRAPARPLFIGRKPCLPSRPVLAEPALEADNILVALKLAPLARPDIPRAQLEDRQQKVRFAIPPSECSGDMQRQSKMLADVRDWVAGVHAGESRIEHFALPTEEIAVSMSAEDLP
ncbi:type I-E CRISPR-associated protein Cas5/CasD [Hyphomicrobium sp. D-2]|uniref:type I-E CRISPR-associated protein Cas5/CasD n=1 Tax=Hyphomicrobium sp. D-2 TaxID=3041621 RepID=UPI002454F4DB|nr:type I-E CRISPR-associated protein Cas5/CasD [Hyphomicrobium sp. D-2]MDH4981169.1 type I-E CRISPR-associated protein Cas5/CasD [Hyphomicrobium sp. D-2]